MLLNSLINNVADLCINIKSCEIFENKGVGFTAQQVMDAILDYAKVPVTIQSYSKSQSYAKSTWTPSDPKYTRHACHCAVPATNSSTSEEVSGLKTNDDRTFTLDGKFYPLRHSYRKKFILGSYLRFLGCRQGEEDGDITKAR